MRRLTPGGRLGALNLDVSDTLPLLTDAKRVLTRAEHQLSGARLSLSLAPPRAPERVLLQGLPPDTSPLSLEQHVRTLLCAVGHPVQACHALASPRQDCALVQLSMPLSEAGERQGGGIDSV